MLAPYRATNKHRIDSTTCSQSTDPSLRSSSPNSAWEFEREIFFASSLFQWRRHTWGTSIMCSSQCSIYDVLTRRAHFIVAQDRRGAKSSIGTSDTEHQEIFHIMCNQMLGWSNAWLHAKQFSRSTFYYVYTSRLHANIQTKCTWLLCFGVATLTQAYTHKPDRHVRRWRFDMRAL